MSAEPVRFTQIVAELEQARGKPLLGRTRLLCLKAFSENEDGFEEVAREVLERAPKNHLGLLYAMVADGDHLKRGPWPGGTGKPLDGSPYNRRAGRCVVCDRETDAALVWGGQFWCRDHEDQAR